MIFLRNRLADFELHVALYYMRRGAYVGALNRAKYCVENYDGAPAVQGSHEGDGRRLPRARHGRIWRPNAERVYADNYPARRRATDAREEVLVEAHPARRRARWTAPLSATGSRW